jgi:RecJ-like exonuclease
MAEPDEIWLILDMCPRCNGTGYIEACYECPQCDGLGMDWLVPCDEPDDDPSEDDDDHL